MFVPLLTMPVEPEEHAPQVATDRADCALLSAFSSRGDREALGELFASHSEAAWRVAQRIAGADDAEDIVHLAFLQVMAAASRRRETGTVRSWILAIVANAARQHQRSTRRRTQHELRAAQEQEQQRSRKEEPETEADSHHLRRWITELPQRYQLPLCLHYLDGLSTSECAVTLSVPEKTVHTWLRRGLQLLRKRAGQCAMVVSVAALQQLSAAEPVLPAGYQQRIHELAVQGQVPAFQVDITSVSAKYILGLIMAATLLGGIAVSILATLSHDDAASDAGLPDQTANTEPTGTGEPSSSNPGEAQLGHDWPDDEEQALAHAMQDGWSGAAFDQLGRYCATGNGDRSIGIWDGNGKLLHSWLAAADLITCLAFAGDRLFAGDGCYTMANADKAGYIRVWDYHQGKLLNEWKAYPGRVLAMAVSDDGNLVASAGNGAEPFEIRLWSGTGELVSSCIMPPHEQFASLPCSIAITPDQRHVLAGDDRGRVFLWDRSGGLPLHRMQPLDGAICRIAVSPNGKLVAIAASGRAIMLAELPSLKPTQVLHGLDKGAFTLHFSPDGLHLAAGGWNGDAAIWRLTDGKQLANFRVDGGTVLSIDLDVEQQCLSAAINRPGGPLTGTIQKWTLRRADGSPMLNSFTSNN